MRGWRTGRSKRLMDVVLLLRWFGLCLGCCIGRLSESALPCTVEFVVAVSANVLLQLGLSARTAMHQIHPILQTLVGCAHRLSRVRNLLLWHSEQDPFHNPANPDSDGAEPAVGVGSPASAGVNDDDPVHDPSAGSWNRNVDVPSRTATRVEVHMTVKSRNGDKERRDDQDDGVQLEGQKSQRRLLLVTAR